MSYSDNIETILAAKDHGLKGGELVAFALLELASVIDRSFCTRYTDASNALELIGDMLGADGGGGADGRNVPGAIRYLAEQIDQWRADTNDLAAA